MLRKLAAALTAAIGIALIAFADAPIVRRVSYGDGFGVFTLCAVRQAAFAPQHLDALILGSSRMHRGVDPAEIVAASNGALSNVYNLASPRRHIVRSMVIFDELLREGHRIDAVVVEVDVDMLRRGAEASWSWDPSAAARATWLDILTSTPPLRGAGPDPRTVLRGLHDKLKLALVYILTGAPFEVLDDPIQTADPVCWGRGFNDAGRPEQLRRLRMFQVMVSRRFPPPRPRYDREFQPPQAERARGELLILDHMRQRARAAGAQLIVVRPQGFTEPVLHPSVVAKLQRLIPEFRYPPEPLARQLSTMQVDGRHYGLEGRALYSRWIAQTILSERDPPRPPQPPAPSRAEPS